MNPCGGAELLALKLSETLHNHGYEVDLVTTEKSRWPRISHVLGTQHDIVNREYVIPPFVTLPTIYNLCFYWLSRDAIFLPLLKKKYDLTIETVQTFPITFADILYIHFPDFSPEYLQETSRKYSSGLMRAYSLPLRGLSELFVRTYRSTLTKPMILTNSMYSQREINRSLGVNSQVVYPPVDVSKWRSRAGDTARRNIVLTISRLMEEKNLDLLPKLIKLVPDAKFIVLGSTDRLSNKYVETLTKEAGRLGVNERFEIKPNSGESEKLSLLSQAKVYLHTMRNEHFGMSIVEAMSAGLVPVVHKSGGPWIDILQETQGRYGYAYNNLEEAAEFITKVLHEEKLRVQLSGRAAKRAEHFDLRFFQKNILTIVRHVLASKRES